MDNVINLFTKRAKVMATDIIPRGTPREFYANEADYLQVTMRPESFNSHHDFLMTLNRFVWVIGTGQENRLVRRSEKEHGMKPYLSDEEWICDDTGSL